MAVDTNGYIFGAEALELIKFTPDKHWRRAADLGCGDGILSMLLATQRQADEIWAIEIDARTCKRAQDNVIRNHLSGIITVQQGNIRQMKQLIQRSSFDLVMLNPPFFTAASDYHTGKSAEQSARKEIHGNLRHFLSTAQFLLKKSGHAMILYHPSRLDHLFVELNISDLIPKDMKLLYHPDGRPLFVLVKAVKNARPGLTIHPPGILPASIKHAMLEES